MEPILDVFVPGPPVGKQRPRVCVRGGRVFAYTPEKTREWEHAASLIIGADAPRRLTCPVRIEVECYLEQLKTKPKTHPTIKPDIDNIAKAALDACVMSSVIVDDQQVTELVCCKYFAGAMGPGVRIRVFELGSEKTEFGISKTEFGIRHLTLREGKSTKITR
jgi:Holliday junction resolvase RusA-like endonuclease